MITQLPPLTRLELRRRALGMSRAALARRAGVSAPTVQRILSGAEQAPSLAVLHAIAAALGVRVSIGSRPTIEEEATPAEFRRRQAESKGARLAQMVQATMGLEAQSVEPVALEAIAQQHVHQLLAGSNRRLWED